MHKSLTQTLLFALDQFAFFAKSHPASLIDKAELAAALGQAQVGIVFTQQQTMLGARSEHAVGLGSAQSNQIIDQNTEIRLIAPRTPGRLTLNSQGRIQTGEQPLGGRLFIAGGAVDLAGEVQTFDRARLQRGMQVARIEEIVFDGITGAGDVRTLESGHAAQQIDLRIERQTGGQAAGIQLAGAQALGLDKHLM